MDFGLQEHKLLQELTAVAVLVAVPVVAVAHKDADFYNVITALGMAEPAVVAVVKVVQQEQAVAVADLHLAYIFSIMEQVQILHNQVF